MYDLSSANHLVSRKVIVNTTFSYGLASIIIVFYIRACDMKTSLSVSNH